MRDFFWEMHQQRRIEHAKSDAAEAKKKAGGGNLRIEQLESDVDRLLLITRTLWEILQNFHGVDDAYLFEKIREVDLRDGRLDGKMKKREAQDCESCGRALNARHLQCIYCGSRNFRKDPFETTR